MSYLVLLKFNSTQNADNFIMRYSAPLQATNAEIPQGYTPLAQGIGSPNPGANPPTSTWVTIEAPTLDSIPQGYQPQFIFDHNTRTVVYTSPNIDPYSLTLKQGDNTVFQNGVPIPYPTTTNYPYPVDPNLFPPVFDQPDLRKLFERQKFVVPPDSQDQPPDVPLDQKAPELPPPIEIPKVPYPPGFLPEPDVPFFDPTQPAEPISPHGWQNPFEPFDDSMLKRPPTGVDPGFEFEPKEQIIKPNLREPKLVPISDSGEGGGLPANSALFTLILEASFSGTTWLTPAQIWWSNDAIRWNLAPTPIDSLPQLQTNTINYFNGLWVINNSFLIDPSAGGTFASSVIYSYSGKSWDVGWNSANFTSGNITVTAVVPSSQFTQGSKNSGLITASFVNIVIPCQMPANPTTNNNGFGDSIYTGSVLVDPRQAAGASATYASNNLPPGITAVRLRAAALEITAFDYTTTPITPAIVSGGYSGATWITSFQQAGQTGALNSNLIYGLPTRGFIV